MWSTQNSRLAAALEVLGYRIELLESDRMKGSVVIHFEPSIDLHAFERAWLVRDEWARNNPDHPFTYMRRCADAHDWIHNSVIFGLYEGVEALPALHMRTRNLHLACCLIADNYFLLQYNRPMVEFVFCDGARLVERKFANECGEDSPIYWMRRYLDGFSELKKKIKQIRVDSARLVRQACVT